VGGPSKLRMATIAGLQQHPLGGTQSLCCQGSTFTMTLLIGKFANQAASEILYLGSKY